MGYMSWICDALWGCHGCISVRVHTFSKRMQGNRAIHNADLCM